MLTSHPARRLIALAIAGTTALALLIGVPLGTPLLDLETPSPNEVVGLGGLEVMVRFPRVERVAPETLRILLNGADVTEVLATGENGAYGRLVGLLEGENVLRVEVFGPLPWLPGWYVEAAREVRVLHRSSPDVNRG